MGTVDKCFFLFFKCKLFERHTKKIDTYVAADDADANVADNANGGDDDDAADADDADDAVAKLNMCGNQDILRGTTLEWKSPPLVN